MNTEHRQQKISFWHSMKTQFIAVVILVAAVIVILYTLMIMPGVKSNIRSMSQRRDHSQQHSIVQ